MLICSRGGISEFKKHATIAFIFNKKKMTRKSRKKKEEVENEAKKKGERCKEGERVRRYTGAVSQLPSI